MKRTKVLLFILLCIPLLFIGWFLSWEYYLRTSFDHHIVSDKNYYMIKNSGNDTEEKSPQTSDFAIPYPHASYMKEWVKLTEKEILSLPEKYRGKIEVKKENGEYFWIDSQGKQKLSKTIKRRYKKVWKRVVRDAPMEVWHIYQNATKDISVYIITNTYEISECYPSYTDGNMYVDHVMENGDLLRYSGWAPVYENWWDEYMCPHYSPSTGVYNVP